MHKHLRFFSGVHKFEHYVYLIIRPIILLLGWLKPLASFAARIWVAEVFFKAGLTKIASWKSTLMLFTYEYHVPLLSAKAAAILGTGAELVLPVLLFLGLGSRIMILIFFIYNLVAAISYPFLWTPDGAMGLQQHVAWGLMLGLLMTAGPGKWSLDYLFFCRHQKRVDQLNKEGVTIKHHF